MDWTGKVLAALACCCAVTVAAKQADFETRKASPDARYVANWALETGDAAGRPFVIVDKKEARLHLFDATGLLLASTAVLLGSTVGDETVPGVGQRAQTSEVGPHERTTPAGRFLTMPGRNLMGEHVVWVDYASAFAIHRLRPGAAREQRALRLATRSPHDNRVSLGCVVVAVDFYEKVLMPLLGSRRGVVYVLPEGRSAREMFGSM